MLKIQEHWQKLNYDQKIAVGLCPDRIDVLDLAMDLILMIINRFEITKIKIPMTGLNEGSIHDLLA